MTQAHAKKGEVIRSYSDLAVHTEVGAIIQHHSENKEDIRLVVRDAVPWNDNTSKVLDLGCGYGWFEEIMPAGLDVVGGIDCLEENEAPFLAAARPKAREVFFFKMMLFPRYCACSSPAGSFCVSRTARGCSRRASTILILRI